MSFSYVISHEKLNLYVVILDISSLHLHEEIIPELLNRLVTRIKRDGMIKHPIIVDRKSLVVLDGMHRVAALKKLNCKKIPVCLVDYENPAVTVGCWYRTIKRTGEPKNLYIQVQRFGTVKEVEKLDETIIGVPPIVAAIKNGSKTFLVHSDFRNHKEAYDIIERIEKFLRKAGFEIGYKTETGALRRLREHKIDAVLLTPKLSKEAIIETALSGKVFTYKATRHIIPARPLFLNIPLHLLGENGKSLEEVNKKLKSTLQKRRLKKISAGSLLEGRRYEEDIYTFEE